jgi:hypothetical protein
MSLKFFEPGAGVFAPNRSDSVCGRTFRDQHWEVPRHRAAKLRIAVWTAPYPLFPEAWEYVSIMIRIGG